MENYCNKCHGMIWGLVGVLILINAFVWPQWTGVDGWIAFFGLLIILGGIAKSFTTGCSCHAECHIETKPEAKAEEKTEVKAEAPKAKKAKK